MGDIKLWLKSAGVRALKTFVQTLAGFITAGAALNEIDWKLALSTATVALIYSLMMSTVGLPELKNEKASDGKIIFDNAGNSRIELSKVPWDETKVTLDVVSTDTEVDYDEGNEIQ